MKEEMYQSFSEIENNLYRIFGLEDNNCDLKLRFIGVELVKYASIKKGEELDGTGERLMVRTVATITTPVCILYQVVIYKLLANRFLMSIHPDQESLDIRVYTKDHENYDSRYDTQSRELCALLGTRFNDSDDSYHKLTDILSPYYKVLMITNRITDLSNPMKNKELSQTTDRIFKRAEEIGEDLRR